MCLDLVTANEILLLISILLFLIKSFESDSHYLAICKIGSIGWSVFLRLHLEKLKSSITDGKGSKVTKKNKFLLSAEEELNKLNYSLQSATDTVCLLELWP